MTFLRTIRQSPSLDLRIIYDNYFDSLTAVLRLELILGLGIWRARLALFAPWAPSCM